MKIILTPHEGASRADLIDLVSAAHWALYNGIADKQPGDAMAVTLGLNLSNTFGVVRRKGCVSVYPPSKPGDPSTSNT